MKDKYKITEEEINQTILHSPFSLVDSPSETGLKAKQIKKYFYEFIRFFAYKINMHLGELGETLSNYDELNLTVDNVLKDIGLIDEKITSLEEKDTELGSGIVASVSAHNQSSESHPELQKKIEADISSHNASMVAHTDIREGLRTILNKLEVTYSLASGKSRVYSCEDVIEALETINKEEMCKGDLLLVADSSLPDFTVFETGLTSMPKGSLELDYNEIASGEMIPEAGKSYYYNGVRLISTIGNVETNLLAKNEDLEELENAFWENIEAVKKDLDAIENTLVKKEEKLEKVESTASEITLEAHEEYNLGLVTALELALPEETVGLEAIVNFRTGATVPTFDSPSELVFSGDDTYEGRFYPITNRLYEINIKEVLGVLVAKVGTTDYEVIE